MLDVEKSTLGLILLLHENGMWLAALIILVYSAPQPSRVHIRGEGPPLPSSHARSYRRLEAVPHLTVSASASTSINLCPVLDLHLHVHLHRHPHLTSKSMSISIPMFVSIYIYICVYVSVSFEVLMPLAKLLVLLSYAHPALHISGLASPSAVRPGRRQGLPRN